MNWSIRMHPLGYREVHPRPTVGELRTYYAERYFQEGCGSYEVSYDSEELAWIRSKSRHRVGLVESYLGSRPSPNARWSLLDVGCGEGFGLSAFEAHGWDVQGIDFSIAGVRSQNPHLEPSVEVGDILSILQERRRRGAVHDCVLLLNVLEHVLDPLELLQSLLRVVRPGGIMLVTVPNDYSEVQLAIRASGRATVDYWVAPPDHLQYFDRDSLARICVEAGWVGEDVLADFPIDWFLFHPGSNYVLDRGLGKSAHRARIAIETLVHGRDRTSVTLFQRGLAAVGMGRDLTGVFRRPASA
jgi:2-polyprenyl-3-methyl-5-hydroxy-6-metoxy-1,4-benzoquinol methylase